MSQVIYDQQARQRVLEGAKILYEAVKTTMGPKGRNIVILHDQGNPTVTHDGVTVAKGVTIEDADDETLGQRAGAELIKQVANKMNDVAGDGTTTVTVLTYHILNEANKLIAAGHNPMVLRRELEAVAEGVLANLNDLAESIEGNGQRVAEVATISAGDPEIGQLIADVIDKIGKDGVITVEEGQSTATESEVVEGFTFDRGYLSAYMVTDTAKMVAEYNNPAILVSDKSIASVRDLVPVLEKLAKAGKRELVIIAENIEGEALATLISNHVQGTFNCVCVRAPSMGDRRRDALQDIATLTGAEILSPDRATEFQEADETSIGRARKVIVTATETTIVMGGGKTEEVEAHINDVKEQAERATSEGDKEYLLRRAAAMQGRVAVIKVGGATETEIEERKYRVDDAVAAVRAALREGIVPGGGVTLVKLAQLLHDSDEGTKILKNALEQPFRIILSNAGLNADEWLPQVKASRGYMGVNVHDPSKLIDVKKEGVIDPVIVTKQAIQNAVSVAGTAMTMGGLVMNKPKQKSPLDNLMVMGPQ